MHHPRAASLLVLALLTQATLEPLVPDAESGIEVHRMGLGSGIAEALHRVVAPTCDVIERAMNCGTFGSIVGAAAAVGGCTLIAGVTAGAGAVPCFASLAVAQGIGMGAAQLSSKACTQGDFVGECLTAPWGGVKKGVQDLREGGEAIDVWTFAAPIVDVGTTMIPLYGVGAVGGRTAAGVASKAAGRGAAAAEKTVFTSTHLAPSLKAAETSLAEAAKAGRKLDAWKNAILGGDKAVLAERLATRGGQLKESRLLAKGYRAGGGHGFPGYGKGVAGAGMEKTAKLLSKTSKVGKATRAGVALGKTGRPLFEGLNSKSTVVVPAAQVPRIPNDRDPTLQPPPSQQDPSDGDGSVPPSPAGVRVTFLSPDHASATVLAADEELVISVRMEAEKGVRLWTAWLNTQQLPLGERFAAPQGTVDVQFKLNAESARLPPGKYQLTVKASDGASGASASLYFGVQPSGGGGVPDEWPGAGAGDCTDVNHNGVPDCIDRVTTSVDPRPGKKGIAGALLGLVLVLVMVGAAAWVLTRG